MIGNHLLTANIAANLQMKLKKKNLTDCRGHMVFGMHRRPGIRTYLEVFRDFLSIHVNATI